LKLWTVARHILITKYFVTFVLSNILFHLCCDIQKKYISNRMETNILANNLEQFNVGAALIDPSFANFITNCGSSLKKIVILNIIIRFTMIVLTIRNTMKTIKNDQARKKSYASGARIIIKMIQCLETR
jgi:hypothetical protein